MSMNWSNNDKKGATEPTGTFEMSDYQLKSDLNATAGDVDEAVEQGRDMTVEQTCAVLSDVVKVHERDPNFPAHILEKIQQFLNNPDVLENPTTHHKLIAEMKTEAALILNNSPYAEVRAVVSNTDDPSMPSLTIRTWIIGLLFVAVLAFINQLFSIRQPSIWINSNVAQLLAFPVGKFAEKVLPDWGFTLFGTRHSLNPGKFSRKEHMLITIMAAVGCAPPYTSNIIWVQYLPRFFNQPFAGTFLYQILNALATSFIGYGVAGVCRRFLVYPTYCVWPASLVTIALNSAFHSETNEPVLGPLRKQFTASRLRFFAITFAGMFVYFWIPGYLFEAFSSFNWMTWISPNNTNLVSMTGFWTGLGFNPIPTFDWNVINFDGQDPLMVPFFTTLNKFAGTFLSSFVIIAMWYSNAFDTGYLPLNQPRVYDHFGKAYNISLATNDKALFDAESYESYSPAYMSAGNINVYMWFFAIYAATASYAALYHRHEILLGFKNLFNSFRKDKNKDSKYEYTDIHNRLMSEYDEVPEWWFALTLLGSIACGCAGLAAFDTNTTVGTVFYGILLCIIFVIPVGIIKAITGVEVTLNVLAEFIGGSWVAGNALAMNFFKTYGYVTCAHALAFSNDLKLAHYVKIPPKHTFSAQMVATLVSAFVCTAVLNYQMNNIPDVCETYQKDKYTCPGINTFFTASVLWGTIGPKKVFGPGGLYTPLLVGFPIGIILPFAVYYVQQYFPKQTWLRQIHPVTLLYGGMGWAPYNISYVWPAVPIGWLSMVYMKKRYLALWSKYNYVLSASFSSAIAIAGVVIFFALQNNSIDLKWWGNTVVREGCEGTTCTRLNLGEGEYFGPRIGEFH